MCWRGSAYQVSLCLLRLLELQLSSVLVPVHMQHAPAADTRIILLWLLFHEMRVGGDNARCDKGTKIGGWEGYGLRFHPPSSHSFIVLAPFDWRPAHLLPPPVSLPLLEYAHGRGSRIGGRGCACARALTVQVQQQRHHPHNTRAGCHGS